MFACIFFNEDASLSVVGKNNKSLKLLSDDWEPRGKVEMYWPGKVAGQRSLYHGTIIKVGGKSVWILLLKDITEQVMTVVCCTFYAATHGCNSGTYIMYMCTFIFKLSEKKIHGKESYFYFLKYLFKIVHNGNSQRVFYQYEQIMNPVYQISNSRIRRPKF